MAHPDLQDVFTAVELARAAGVSRRAVDALIETGELRTIPGTRFIAADAAIHAGRRLQNVPLLPADAPELRPAPLFSVFPGSSGFANRRGGLPACASSFVHAAIFIAVILFTSGSTETASEPVREDDARLVFLMTPGPGGGGGGGGLKNPLPAPRLERRGPQRARLSVPAAKPERVLTSRRVEERPRPTPAPPPVPKPVERAPEPLPSNVLVAPVATTAASEREREGVIEKPRGVAESQGPGADGGAGAGQGTGNGEGAGSGLGDGSGGGTGGGPFRPGSGIEPPRIVREVKAEYTDEARRRNLTGDVVLEIVVKRDGTVGDITILQGLGSGLDQRAVSAVRQWRFTPARRQGQPVDVIVEVAVEFTLR